MKRKVLAMITALILTASLSACGKDPTPANPTTGTQSDTLQTSLTDAPSDNPSAPQTPVGKYTFDPNLDHKILVTDVKNGSVAVLDLNRCRDEEFSDLTEETCVVWEWDGGDANLAGVKFRESSYYNTYVVLAAASGGWAKVIDYGSKKELWSVDKNIHNAHSIEMLPDGDIIVAACGHGEKEYTDGGLHYYPAGSTEEAAFLELPCAHAALWDPEKEVLWSVGYEGIVAVKITKTDGKVTLTKVPDLGVKKREFSGHDMVPASEPGTFWVSDHPSLYLFDSNKNTLTKNIPYTDVGIKGIASFADGTMVMSVANTGKPMATVFSQAVTVKLKESAHGKIVKKDILFSDREFYKIHAFDENYR